MANRFLKVAVVYFLLGNLLGMFMGISEDHTLIPVHAHINLLGWVSLALAGIVYRLFPTAAKSRLAPVHFWLYNIGLPIMMVAIAIELNGHPAVKPAIGIGAMLVIAAVVLFAVNVFRNVSSRDA